MRDPPLCRLAPGAGQLLGLSSGKSEKCAACRLVMLKTGQPCRYSIQNKIKQMCGDIGDYGQEGEFYLSLVFSGDFKGLFLRTQV